MSYKEWGRHMLWFGVGPWAFVVFGDATVLSAIVLHCVYGAGLATGLYKRDKVRLA